MPLNQSERLERIAESRRGLDVSVSGDDIALEAIDEHLARLERSPETKRDRRPNRPNMLFDFLFDVESDQAFNRISEGVIAMFDNAKTLLDDASVLVDAKRFARAQFLIATAQEEMGKAYILLDMCRVDLARHQHVLRRLCRSFYNHVLKHVYLDFSDHEYWGIQNLSDLQAFFRDKAQEWWPSSPESGEPDMPHDTYFLREANLYVDVDSSHADSWTRANFAGVLTSLSDSSIPEFLQEARKTLRKLHATQNLGLLEPAALQIFNKNTKSLFVSEQTTMDGLHAVYERTGMELQTSLGVPLEDFRKSVLHNWPLYWISLN